MIKHKPDWVKDTDHLGAGWTNAIQQRRIRRVNAPTEAESYLESLKEADNYLSAIRTESARRDAIEAALIVLVELDDIRCSGTAWFDAFEDAMNHARKVLRLEQDR